MDNVKAAAENSETTLIAVERIPTCFWTEEDGRTSQNTDRLSVYQ